MASRAHHWKPTNTVKITTAVQRQMEREHMSARVIRATPRVPRSGAYQGVIKILAAKVSKNIRTGPAIATNTPRSSRDRPGCRAVVLFRSFITGSFHQQSGHIPPGGTSGEFLPRLRRMDPGLRRAAP